MRPLRFGAALTALACATPCAAQASAEGFQLSGTSRLRVEAIDGQVRAGFNESDTLVNLRTTLLAQYRDGPVRVAAELWDSRVANADRGTPVTTGEVNAFELVQAFAEWSATPAAGAGLTLRGGRFLLNLGSRRLVAADDYRNTTNGYTGLHGEVALAGGWRTSLIYVLPQQRRPDDAESLRDARVAPDREGFDQVLWGGVASRAKAIGAATVEASFLHLGERDMPGRPTRDRSLNTAAIRLIRDPAPGRFDGEVEAIGQSGRISADATPGAARLAVAAWFLHADAGYTFAGGWKPRVSIEYDHASGDRPGGRYGRFDTLFGMRRADFSPAGLLAAIGRTNIVSPGVRVEAVPGGRTDLMASLRPMWLAAREDAFSTSGVRDPSGGSGAFAGTQFDGRLRHRLDRHVQLELDVTLLAKGRFLRAAPNAPPGRWTRYLSLNALASF